MRRSRRDRWPAYLALALFYTTLQYVSSQTSSPSPSPSPSLSTAFFSASPTSERPVTTEESATTSPRPHGPTPHPTWRPRRENCTPPAIEQFPRPLMGPWGREHGGLIIHLLVAIYTFLGLAIVCDEYFVASLDRICEELQLTPDVAGATFMAAGSSAPELATVVIGVFFAKDDIGISGVIGSAVFNIMFVISVCALCAGTVCHLNWWPLARDCFFYAVAILVMLCTIFDEVITWGESLFMLILYVVYCVTLHFNPRLEVWAQTTRLAAICKAKAQAPEEQTGLVTYRNLADDKRRASYTSPQVERVVAFPQQDMTTTIPQDLNAGWDMDGPVVPAPIQPPPPVAQAPPPVPPPPAIAASVAAQSQDYYKPKEAPAEEVSPLVMPENATVWTKFSWGVTVPIHACCRATIPNCRLEKWRRWYPFTFVVSMIWISFYSYLMVWMITVIGTTLGIPDTVMGLTFVAAGVSVPDALSSLAVVKEGYGDMAVSNAVGSNVFDILICLGLPWFIQTAIIAPGSHVNVYSKGLTYSTLSLLSTVLFLLAATHLNGWKLDKKYGVILMLWYLFFIAFASLYELNVFGQLNPEQCPSMF